MRLFCRLTIGLYLALACLAIETFGLFGGYTIFRTGLTTFYIAMHFIGCVGLSFFMTESWHYATFWYLFILCSALPAAVELMVILGSTVRGD